MLRRSIEFTEKISELYIRTETVRFIDPLPGSADPNLMEARDAQNRRPSTSPDLFRLATPAKTPPRQVCLRIYSLGNSLRKFSVNKLASRPTTRMPPMMFHMSLRRCTMSEYRLDSSPHKNTARG